MKAFSVFGSSSKPDFFQTDQRSLLFSFQFILGDPEKNLFGCKKIAKLRMDLYPTTGPQSDHTAEREAH